MKWKVSRDLVIFMVGLLGIVWETTVSSEADPQLIILFSAMIGLPAFLARDDHKRNGK